MSKRNVQRGTKPAAVAEYETVWTNKFLTAGAKTLDEMIDALQKATDELRAMRAAGVELRHNGGVADDYATLVTADPKVAKKFGFKRVEDSED